MTRKRLQEGHVKNSPVGETHLRVGQRGIEVQNLRIWVRIEKTRRKERYDYNVLEDIWTNKELEREVWRSNQRLKTRVGMAWRRSVKKERSTRTWPMPTRMMTIVWPRLHHCTRSLRSSANERPESDKINWGNSKKKKK